MNDTTADEEVGVDDASGVDKDGSVDNGDVDLLSRHGGDAGVGEGARICHSPVDDVVFQDVSKVGHGEVAQTRGNVEEGRIGRREDGHVFGIVNGGGQIGGRECADKRRQVCSFGDSGCGGRDGEKRVDDVNDTAGEVEVLL